MSFFHRRRWEPSLHSFVDGELDAAANLRVSHHLSSCEACSFTVVTIKKVKATLRQYRVDPVDVLVIERLKAGND